MSRNKTKVVNALSSKDKVAEKPYIGVDVVDEKEVAVEPHIEQSPIMNEYNYCVQFGLLVYGKIRACSKLSAKEMLCKQIGYFETVDISISG